VSNKVGAPIDPPIDLWDFVTLNICPFIIFFADTDSKPRLEYEQTFLSRLIIGYYEILDSIDVDEEPNLDAVRYCERLLELLIDLEAQLPTRRYLNSLVDDHLVVPVSSNSSLAKAALSNGGNSAVGKLFLDMLSQLSDYTHFQIDDVSGSALSEAEVLHLHYERIQQFQKLCFVKYRESLEDLALSSVGNMHEREKFASYLSKVDDEVLVNLCKDIGVRTKRPGKTEEEEEELSREFLVEVILDRYSKRKSQLEKLIEIPLYPTEESLFDNSTLVPADETFKNHHSLPIPKLNLQFLTITDYLLRNFKLYQLESSYEIKQDIEDAVKRMNPKFDYESKSVNPTYMAGWARMAAGLDRVSLSNGLILSKCEVFLMMLLNAFNPLV
jgi:intron-binding protein aquarius